MRTLEQIVRGAAVGAGTILDPIGASINLIDMQLSGAGPGDRERAIPTAWAKMVQAAYPENAPRPTTGQYIARLGGFVGGSIGAVVAGAYAVTAAPVLGLTGLALGTYGLIRGIGRYAKNLVVGERIHGKYEKGSFIDGLRFGWHKGSYGIPWMRYVPGLRYINAAYNPMVAAHVGEALLNGKGYGSSTLGTSRLRSAAGGVRRNLASIVGNVIGTVAGVIASPITGIYKTARDFFGFGGTYAQGRPAYVRASARTAHRAHAAAH